MRYTYICVFGAKQEKGELQSVSASANTVQFVYMQSNFKHTSENCWILYVVILHVHWTGSAKFLFLFY